MKDVAKHAGVALITVSRVVNSSGPVNAETRRRVEDSIRELNYVPNRIASNLRSRQSDLLALVLPDITNSFWTSIARGVEDEAWSKGYGVFICNTDNDLEKEAAYIESLIRRRVEGVLIVPTWDMASQTQLLRLRQHRVNFVVIHRPLAGFHADVVRTDGEAAAEKLTSALVDAGCRRIAFVGQPLEDLVSKERLDGYRTVLAAAGLPFRPDLVVTGQDGKDHAGYGLVRDLLTRKRPPDGIFLANSRIAAQGLRAIADAGLTIPDDVVVAAFHDINTMDHYASRLIRAVQPSYLMGQLATRRLLEIRGLDDPGYEDLVLASEIHSPQPAILPFRDTVPA